MPQPSLPGHVLQMTPANADAKHAFNDLSSALKENPESKELLHASRFMYIEPYQQDNQTASDLITGASIDLENTETDTATELETDSEGQAVQFKYQGSYTISLEQRPNFPLIGWVVGQGRWQSKGSKPNGGVDLQLALPRTPFAKYEVAGRHARIFIDETGSFIVRTISDRSPKVRLGIEEFTSGQRVITERRCRISFGKLEYVLEFAIDNEDNYQRDLRKYFTNHLFRRPAPPDLAATPSPWDSKLGDWLVRGTVGKGSFATVSAAKHIVTGETGAAKFMVRTQETQRAVAQEVEILKSLPIHPRILRFRDVQYERRESWFGGPSDVEDERYSFRARPERVVIIYSPFARATVTEFFNDIPVLIRLVAFQQLLQGVSALHKTFIIHRDLKPGNWGVVNLSKQDIDTVILDYGHSTRAKSCKPTPGSIGTIPYLAPEMELKTYGPGVDIWACGIIGRQLFVTEGKLGWKNVIQEKGKFDTAMAALQKEPVNTIGNLLSQLLAWDPSKRVSAEVALEHACFSNLPVNSQPLAQSGQKRARNPSQSS